MKRVCSKSYIVTIEERASQYAENDLCFIVSRSNYLKNTIEKAYACGASEQDPISREDEREKIRGIVFSYLSKISSHCADHMGSRNEGYFTLTDMIEELEEKIR